MHRPVPPQSLLLLPFLPLRPAIAAASAHVLGKAQTYLANAEDIIARADDKNKPLRATGLLTLAAIAVLGACDSAAHHAALDANLAAQAERLETKLALTQKNFSDLQQELEVTLPACRGDTVLAAPINTASFQQPEETPTPSSSSRGTQTDSEKAEANIDTEQSIHTRIKRTEANLWNTLRTAIVGALLQTKRDVEKACLVVRNQECPRMHERLAPLRQGHLAVALASVQVLASAVLAAQEAARGKLFDASDHLKTAYNLTKFAAQKSMHMNGQRDLILHNNSADTGPCQGDS